MSREFRPFLTVSLLRTHLAVQQHLAGRYYFGSLFGILTKALEEIVFANAITFEIMKTHHSYFLECL